MGTAVNRRALIGGAGIVGVLASAPLLATTTAAQGDPRWSALLAEYRAAWAHAQQLSAECRRLDTVVAARGAETGRRPGRPAALAEWNARSAVRDEIMGDTEDRWEAAHSKTCNIANEVCEYPVASFSALAEKADVLCQQWGDELEHAEAFALANDIRRLAKKEA